MESKVSINDQWWELYDNKRDRYYYYHPNSGARQWKKPEGSVLITKHSNGSPTLPSKSSEEKRIEGLFT